MLSRAAVRGEGARSQPAVTNAWDIPIEPANALSLNRVIAAQVDDWAGSRMASQHMKGGRYRAALCKNLAMRVWLRLNPQELACHNRIRPQSNLRRHRCRLGSPALSFELTLACR